MANPPIRRISSEITIASAGRCRNIENMNDLYPFRVLPDGRFRRICDILFRVILQASKYVFWRAKLEFDLLTFANLANPLEDQLFALV